MDYLVLIIVCAIAFSIRSYPSAIKGCYGNDSFYHMMVGRSFRRSGKLPKMDPNMLPKYQRTYPPLLHVILYPFGRGKEDLAFKFLSPAIDTITIVILFFTVEWLGIGNAIWISLVYALSPMNVNEASNLNPRTLSTLLLSSIMVLFLVISSISDENELFLTLSLAASLLAGLFLLNKLATQMIVPLLFFSTAYLLVTNPSMVVLIPLVVSLAVLINMILTRGEYLNTLVSDHLEYLKVHLKHGHYSTGEKALESPLTLLKCNPIAILGPVTGLIIILSLMGFRGDWYFFGWGLLVIVVAQLWFWGDGRRYLQYGTFPGSILLVMGIFQLFQDSVIAPILMGLICIGLFLITTIQLMRYRIRNDHSAKMIQLFSEMPTGLKEDMKGARVYSDIRSYAIPYITSSMIIKGNPSSHGLAFNVKLDLLDDESPAKIREFVAREMGEEIDFFVFFKPHKTCDTDDLIKRYESASLNIYSVEVSD